MFFNNLKSADTQVPPPCRAQDLLVHGCKARLVSKVRDCRAPAAKFKQFSKLKGLTLNEKATQGENSLICSCNQSTMCVFSACGFC